MQTSLIFILFEHTPIYIYTSILSLYTVHNLNRFHILSVLPSRIVSVFPSQTFRADFYPSSSPKSRPSRLPAIPTPAFSNFLADGNMNQLNFPGHTQTIY